MLEKINMLLSVVGVLDSTAGALVHKAGSCFIVLLAALLYDRKYPGAATPVSMLQEASGQDFPLHSAPPRSVLSR